MASTECYFAVCGSGRFPFDMLRYDQCHPFDQEDSHAMDGDWADGFRAVVLVHRAPSKSEARGWCPTTARWRSFTWDVLVVRGETAYDVQREVQRLLREREDDKARQREEVSGDRT